MSKLRFSLLFLLPLFLASLAACRAPSSTSSDGQVAAAVSYMPKGGAKLSGTIFFEGKPPTPKKLRMGSFPECSQAHPQGVAEDILVKEGKVQNVFVYVKEGVTQTFPTPTTPVLLDQKGCIYLPHLFGIQVGQPLSILNSDTMIHNIHALAGEATLFNVAMPIPGQKLTQTFSIPYVMVELKCDIHGWMKGYAGVLNHPYYFVTGEDGHFELQGLPPGPYTLAAWHERFGEETQKVTLGPDESRIVQFRFKH